MVAIRGNTAGFVADESGAPAEPFAELLKVLPKKRTHFRRRRPGDEPVGQALMGEGMAVTAHVDAVHFAAKDQMLRGQTGKASVLAALRLQVLLVEQIAEPP